MPVKELEPIQELLSAQATEYVNGSPSPEAETQKKFTPFVQVIEHSLLPPDLILGPNGEKDAPVHLYSLTGTTVAEKNDLARNPRNIGFVGAAMDPKISDPNAAHLVYGDKLQSIPLVIQSMEPIQRFVEFDVNGENGTTDTIQRDERVVGLHTVTVIPPIGARPRDKIARVMQLPAEDIQKLFEDNALGSAPLVSSLRAYEDDEGWFTSTGVITDLTQLMDIREYISDNAQWFELSTRLKILNRVLLQNSFMPHNVTRQQLDLIGSMASIAENYNSSPAAIVREAFATIFPTNDPLSEAYLQTEILLEHLDVRTRNNNGAENFSQAYKATYEEYYFEQVMLFEDPEVIREQGNHGDIQKMFIDAIAFSSLTIPSVTNLQKFGENNRYIRDYFDALAEGVMNLPNALGYYENMPEITLRMNGLKTEKRQEMAAALKRALFGSEEHYDRASKTARSLIESIHSNLQTIADSSQATAGEFAKAELRNLEPAIIENDLPELLSGMITGQLNGEVLTSDQRYQVIRHLMLMRVAHENALYLDEKLQQKPELLDRIKAMKESAQGPIAWDFVDGVKNEVSFLRKTIERTPREKVTDLFRVTLYGIGEAAYPEEQFIDLAEVLNNLIMQDVEAGKKVTINKMKGHPVFIQFLSQLKEYWDEQSPELVTFIEKHEGSGANFRLEEVYWAKCVYNGMEVAFCANDEEFKKKKAEDKLFHLRRLCQTKSGMAVIDALAAPLREEILRQFYEQGLD